MDRQQAHCAGLVVYSVVGGGGGGGGSCCYQRMNRSFSSPHTGYGRGGGKRVLFNGTEWRVIMVML